VVTGSLNTYPYYSCGAPATSRALTTMTVQLVITGGQAALSIWYDCEVGLALYAFYDEASVSTPVDCTAQIAFTNDASCGSIQGFNRPYLYEDGSATCNVPT